MYLFKNKYFTVVAIGWASIISYSRIYLGVHYPADIITGAVLGIILGIVIFKLYQYLLPKIYKS
ncbi:phosphatase PAP2 family protein [Bacteroidota bacterium]